MQLWRLNEGTYDVIKNGIPHEEYLLSAKFQVFPWCSFRDTEVQIFLVFPTWLLHYVTYDILITIKSFYMSSRTYGENLVSIEQAVAEKNTKVCADKQADRQTDKRDANLSHRLKVILPKRNI